MDNICESLTCSDPANGGKCFKSPFPAADGTTCAINKVTIVFHFRNSQVFIVKNIFEAISSVANLRIYDVYNFT